MNLVIRKTKASTLLYIQKSFRKNGKSSSKNVENLGSVETLMKKMNKSYDEVIAWARKKCEEYTNSEVKENKNVLVKFDSNRLIDSDTSRSYNAGYLFLQKIYYDLRFDNTFRNIKNKYDFDYDIDSIFSDLVYSRILEPGSKLSSFDTAKTFLETPKYKLHDIYRALSILAKEFDYIQAEIYKNSNLINSRKPGVLYYDCSNYYFEIEDEDDIKKYGKSKEHRPNPIVQMGLFMDMEGIPLAFSIFDGNSNEQKSLIPLERKIIKDYDFSKFIVCTDAGLASHTNKLFNSTKERAFIISQSLKKLKKDDLNWVMKDEGWKRLSDDKKVSLNEIKQLDEDNNTYYKEEPFDDKDISNQRLIVTYSPKYAKYQKAIRDKQVNRALHIIETGKYRTVRNENDPYRFIKNIKTTQDGEIANTSSLIFDDEVLENEAKFDGLYACTSNLEDDIVKIIEISKGRWEIEECFRIMKTEFSARPVYLQRSDRIKAHFLTCYTALVIIKLLEKKIKHISSLEKIIDTLRSYKLLKIDEGYIPEYKRNDITDKLHEAFNFRTDYEINKPSKIKNIIKNTKI